MVPYWMWSSSMPPDELLMRIALMPPASVTPRKRSSAVVPEADPSGMPAKTSSTIFTPLPSKACRVMVPLPSVQTMPKAVAIVGVGPRTDSDFSGKTAGKQAFSALSESLLGPKSVSSAPVAWFCPYGGGGGFAGTRIHKGKTLKTSRKSRLEGHSRGDDGEFCPGWRGGDLKAGSRSSMP